MTEHLSNGQFARKEITEDAAPAKVEKSSKPHRFKKGDTVGFFRALENAIGKPTERHEVKGDLNLNFRWQD